MERGFDLSSEEGINQWMATYNAELAAGAGLPIPLPGERSENARQFHDRLKPRTVLGMYQMDPNWTLPSKIDDNLLAWMIQVNGLVIDARHAPRAIQEEAFRKGLIPYIPAE